MSIIFGSQEILNKYLYIIWFKLFSTKYSYVSPAVKHSTFTFTESSCAKAMERANDSPGWRPMWSRAHQPMTTPKVRNMWKCFLQCSCFKQMAPKMIFCRSTHSSGPTPSLWDLFHKNVLPVQDAPFSHMVLMVMSKVILFQHLKLPIWLTAPVKDQQSSSGLLFSFSFFLFLFFNDQRTSI